MLTNQTIYETADAPYRTVSAVSCYHPFLKTQHMNPTKRILLAAITVTACASQLSADNVMRSPSLANTRIQGVMMYDNDKSVENTGVYSYSVTAPVSRKAVTIIDRITVTGDAVVNDGKLYTFKGDISYGYVNSANYYVYDLTTGQQTGRTSMGYDLATVYGHMASSSATDPTTGKVYVSGYTYNSETKMLHSELKTWDLTANTKTTVGSLPGSLIAMAFDTSGQLYGITGSPTEAVDRCGMLVKIDKTTGKCTLVGDTGVKPKFDQSAVIDPATGVFYWFANDVQENANLYTVDLTTGKATLIGALPNGDEVVAAWIPAQTTADGAPSPASNLAPAFEGRSLKGSLKFDVPALDFSGKTLSGDIAWKVTNAGNTLALGKATAGISVDTPIEVDKAGMTTLTVILENEAGPSPAEDVTLYIGPDVPQPVGNLTLSRTGTVNTLSWTASAKGINNAYMVASELTYRITRMPEGKVVAESLSGTSFSEEFNPEQLQSVSYAVTPVNHGVEGQSVTSNPVQSGSALMPPFADNLATASSFDLYTVIDANNDAKTWAYYNKTIRYTANVRAAADDWLILPPMKLEAGYSYEFSFDGYGNNARYTNTLDIHLGTSATATAMGNAIRSVSYSNTSSAPITEKVILYPETTGIYHIGLHIQSAAAQSYMYIKNINVSAGRSTAVPAKIADLTVTPAEKGALSATIQFTAPTLTAGGATLTNMSGITVKRGTETIATLQGADLNSGLLTVTDTQIPTSGEYTYTVTPVNSIGEGEPASASAYIGMDHPLAPTDVKLTDNFDGTATATWTAPAAVGQNGGYVDLSNVVYTVKSSRSTVIKSDIKGTKTDIPFDINADTQSETYIKVSAQNAGSSVKSADVNSDTILAGKPYVLPYKESFTGAAYQTNPWVKEVISGKSYNSSWALRADADQDGDGAGADLNAQAAGSISRLAGPKIDISKAVKPVLSLWVKIPYDNMKFALQLKSGNGEWITVRELADETEWTNVTVELAQHASPALRIGLYGEAVKTGFIYVDNINVTDGSTTGVTDLTADGISVTADNGTITVSAPEAADIAVYTTSGVCLAHLSAAAAEIPVPAGLYIVRVNNHTVKTAVK